jgi:Icc-related predicted phosphoesterase
MKTIRVVCISDTHELHREVDVPPGDLLIHAGDFTFFSKSESQIDDFNEWLGGLPHPHKIVVPGNHESVLEDDPDMRHTITNAVLLIDEATTVAGLKIWGSPVTPLYGGAFGISNAKDRRKHWARIPTGTDILVTHVPPYGILDTAPGSTLHEGCPELLEAVGLIEPRLHVFGHIHGAHGILRTEHTIFVNAALFGQGEDLDRFPVVLEL